MKTKFQFWMGEANNRWKLTGWIVAFLAIVALVSSLAITAYAGHIWGAWAIVSAMTTFGLNTYFVSNDDRRP